MRYFVLIYVLIHVLFNKGYMSTRITPRGGATLDDNRALSCRRQQQCGRVLNPIVINTGLWKRVLHGWGHTEYMWVWNKVLWAFAYMGKPMYYYPCDHVTSRGGQEEYDTALRLGIKVIPMIDKLE